MFIHKIKSLAVLGLCSSFLLLVSCADTSSNTLVVEPTAFQEKIKANPNALILDVRTPQEFAEGHIDKAQNIDWNAGDFEQAIKDVPKDQEILLYCKGGGRSAGAMVKLQEMGFTNVTELKGGMMAWNNEFGQQQPEKPTSTQMTMQDFEKLIDTDKTVLVDFYAEWCAPCQKMKPFLHQMAQDMSSELKIVQIDVDKNPNIANLFRVDALPTLMIYKNKVKEWHHLGYMSQEELTQKIKATSK